MLKTILRKFFARKIYPTIRSNWYKNKGYIGSNDAELFENFVSLQRNKDAIFYKEFQGLILTRQFINSGNHLLDSVIISMPMEKARHKPGFNLCFVFFQGRGEYYESRFRDMARQCMETGASVLGFNPKGFHSSTGHTCRISDLVDDGISIVNYLLSQGKSLDQIILQGNSLGGAISEMVSQHFQRTLGASLRQINSNSFKNLSAVFAHYYHLSLFEKLLYKIMQYSQWEIDVTTDFYTTGPHRCYFRRYGDRTIMPEAEYHSMVNHEKDYINCPDDFKNTLQFLNAHNQLINKNVTDKDPHDLSLHHFITKPLSSAQEPQYSIYDLINRFISNSQI